MIDFLRVANLIVSILTIAPATVLLFSTLLDKHERQAQPVYHALIILFCTCVLVFSAQSVFILAVLLKSLTPLQIIESTWFYILMTIGNAGFFSALVILLLVQKNKV